MFHELTSNPTLPKSKKHCRSKIHAGFPKRMRVGRILGSEEKERRWVTYNIQRNKGGAWSLGLKKVWDIYNCSNSHFTLHATTLPYYIKITQCFFLSIYFSTYPTYIIKFLYENMSFSITLTNPHFTFLSLKSLRKDSHENIFHRNHLEIVNH